MTSTSRGALGGRHTGRPQSVRQLLRIVASGELGDVEVERVGVLESVRQGGVARVVDQRGGTELLTQLAPSSVVVHRNADPVAADARVAAVRGHVGMAVAVGQQLRSGEFLGEQAVADHRRQGLHRRHVDELAFAGQVAVQQCRDGGERGGGADGGVPVPHAGAQRRPAGIAHQ